MPSLIDSIKNNLKLICLSHCTSGRVNSAPIIKSLVNSTLSFDAEAVQLLSGTVDKIRAERPQIEQNFSTEYLEEELTKIIFLCQPIPIANIDKSLLSEITKLIKRLQSTVQSWVFFVPITNLKFENLKRITIGAVTFYDLNPNTLKYLRSEFKAIIGNPKLTESYSDFVKQKIGVLAVTKIEAGDTAKASSKALLQVERSLSILRFYNFNNQFGTQRELSVTNNIEDIHWTNLTTNNSGSSLRALSISLFFPFTISRSDISLMRKKGNLSGFNKLLNAAYPTKLESKLLTSLHWYGLAVKDEQDVDRFVKLMVSLESLVLNKNDEPKKYLLADRSAFILGKKKDARNEIFALVANAYSIRGDIVHEGRYEISKEETNRVLFLLRALILKLMKLSNGVSSLEEISQKIKEIKFGSPINI